MPRMALLRDACKWVSASRSDRQTVYAASAGDTELTYRKLFRSKYLALAALAFCAGRAQPATPVILISVDTLRADHLSCYQPGRRQTPHIDSLAKNGTLFSQISSPFPLTLPSHVVLFTSTYPFASGVQGNDVPLQPAAATLATVFTN